MSRPSVRCGVADLSSGSCTVYRPDLSQLDSVMPDIRSGLTLANEKYCNNESLETLSPFNRYAIPYRAAPRSTY